jgi:Icc-related predicted phosphoesterase
MRVAAVGDIHAGADRESADRLHQGLAHLRDTADVLLLAGDLTRGGEPAEAQVVADAVARTGVRTVAVFGNHDEHAGRSAECRDVLGPGGVTIVEGRGVTLDVPGGRLGVAGVKGFGGGFAGACVTEFGEDETKAFARHSADAAARLKAALGDLDAVDLRVALLHYAPVRATLRGESRELYPFLGSYLLAEAIDEVGADLVVHGHAHRGRERGTTPGGIPVRNVAQPVIRSAYRVFDLVPGRVRRSRPGSRVPS